MTKVRFRLSGFHYFWFGSVLISFFFGLLDKQCSITFAKFEEASSNEKTYQRRLETPLTLFAPLQSTHNEIIRNVLSQTDDVSVGGTGFMVTTHYMIRKAMGWYNSAKESARLAEAGCSKIVLEDVIQEALIGSATLPKGKPRAVAGECYMFPVYREWARVYNDVIADPAKNNEDSNENFAIGNTNRHLRLATIRSNLQLNFKAEMLKMKSMDEKIKVVILFQNPRQWALEIVNERFDLPTSEEYIHVLKEWVIMTSNLFTQCDDLNASTNEDTGKSNRGMCTIGRIEDVTGQPAATFGVEGLFPQKFVEKNLYELPIVEKEVDEILSTVQREVKKLGYDGWETSEEAHKIDLFSQ